MKLEELMEMYEYYIKREDYIGLKEFLMKSDDGKDPNIYLIESTLYVNGFGVEKDYDKASFYLDKAYNLDNDLVSNVINGYEAIYKITNEEKYLNKFLEYLNIAVELNKEDAILKIASMYEDGLYVKEDKVKAFSYFEKLALVNPYGYSCMARCYQDGVGVISDYKKAFQLYKKAGEGNDAEGLTMTGYCYENGEGVGKDINKAIVYYKKGTEAGNKNAPFFLAEIYVYGIGVKKNVKEAIKYYEKSIELGSIDAISALAMVYLGMKDSKVFDFNKAQYYLGLLNNNDSSVNSSDEVILQ